MNGLNKPGGLKLGRRPPGLLALAALAVCLPLGAAQTPSTGQRSSALQGTVRDSQGQPVAGAAVVLQGPGAAKPLTTQTAAGGTYAFPELPAGDYSVRSEKVGCGMTAIPTLMLAPEERKRLDLVLQAPGGAPGASAAAAGHAASPQIQFSDQPQFTVAGLTNWTYTGGHGSDSRLQAAESLAQETRSLPSRAAGQGSTTAASEARLRELRQAREQVRAALALHNSAELHRQLGGLDERLGDPLEAVREYEQAVRLDPSERNYFDWGTELLLHRASGPAVQVFTRGHQAHARSARMLMGLGVAYYARGSYSEAVRWLSAAADLDPANPHPYLFLGKMESASPTPLAGVDRELERFLRLHPANAWANYYAALSRWKRLRASENAAGLTQVKRLLDRALELDPRLGEAWVLRGNLRAQAGDGRAAVDAYRRALEANPLLAEPHYRLALAYRRMGREADAQRELATYEQESKRQDAEAEGRRKEIQQFVIVWKNQPPGPPPQ
jgi:tetratricopeptide (TPR) repeat protein